jgi:hypothetical protein
VKVSDAENANEGAHDPEGGSASGFGNVGYAKFGAAVSEMPGRAEGGSCRVLGHGPDCGHGDGQDPALLSASDRVFGLGLQIDCGFDDLVYSFDHRLGHPGSRGSHGVHPYHDLETSRTPENVPGDGLCQGGMCAVAVSDYGSGPVGAGTDHLGPQVSHALLRSFGKG